MTWEWLGPVVVLALVDSTSIGTLVIPLWLLLAPRIHAGRVLVYLGAVAAAYLVLGLALVAGAALAADVLVEALGSRPGQVLRLIAGLVLLVLGLTIEPWTKAGKAKREGRRQQRIAERGPSRWQRWRTAVADGEAATVALMLLALTAVAIEAASMLPYLAAIGILSTAGLQPLALVAVLAAYCLVMVAPAVVLLGLRIALHERIAPTLARIERWVSRSSREAIAWVLFLLGLWITAGAATELGIVAWLDRL